MWSYIKKWFNQLFNKKEEIVVIEKPVKQQKTPTKRKKYTSSLKLWGDTTSTTGVIVQYKDGMIRYNYLKNKKTKGFTSSYNNCLSFAKKFQDVNYDLDKWNTVKEAVLMKPRPKNKYKYITKLRNQYKIQKFIKGKNYGFGVWRTPEEAEQVVQWLKSKNWDIDYSSTNCGYTQEEYRNEILTYIRIDEDIKNRK